MLALTERHSEMPAPSKSAMPVTVPDPDNKPTRYSIRMSERLYHKVLIN